jgi:hypothetical protein
MGPFSCASALHKPSSLTALPFVRTRCPVPSSARAQLFETGVDEMSWDDLSQARTDWPTIRDCHAYRKTAYDVVLKLLQVCACRGSGNPKPRPESLSLCLSAAGHLLTRLAACLVLLLLLGTHNTRRATRAWTRPATGAMRAGRSSWILSTSASTLRPAACSSARCVCACDITRTLQRGAVWHTPAQTTHIWCQLRTNF